MGQMRDRREYAEQFVRDAATAGTVNAECAKCKGCYLMGNAAAESSYNPGFEAIEGIRTMTADYLSAIAGCTGTSACLGEVFYAPPKPHAQA